MTDQDPKSNVPSAGGSAVVVMEKTISSRHKSFRSTELSDQTPAELHHKRSRAPAVPSVAEEYKDLPESEDIREHKGSELAMTSEKPKRRASKKSSKRAPSPEPIAMKPIEVEVVQRADITPSSATQPIPSPVDPGSDIIDSKDIIDNEDSITEEIADLRNAESVHKEWDTANVSLKFVPEKQEAEETIPLQIKLLSSAINDRIDNEIENKNKDPVVGDSEVKILPSQRKLASGTDNEGITSTKHLKKKEITWTRSTYLDKVQLQNLNTRSVAWMLDQKASVGPCFKKTLPFGEPSGIAICLPKKSVKSFNENLKPSKSGGISITVSKRCLDNALKLSSDYEMRMKTDRVIFPRHDAKLKIEDGHCATFLDNLKGKLENWRGKIKHALHM
ncbi:hypothetical protein PYW08_004379 [Mythimna loreyi]|uniref:Uncharacterized protein n=1 Tax=Mythimna loreyi TaxID=667449 RepID=A0ACC2QNQ3_9NEOP|nr:hypothetical protein PYW08_004379 [Mythimna loreyi]